MADWFKSFWAVQVVETHANEAEAQQLMTFHRTQDGFIGGRISAPPSLGWWDAPGTPAPTRWKSQAIFDDCGETAAPHLPEGMRRVLVLPSMKNMFIPKET